MRKYNKRTGYCFSIEDGDASITTLKPLSGEYYPNGLYLVIYEDAYGELTINILSKDEISKKYNINREDLEEIG